MVVILDRFRGTRKLSKSVDISMGEWVMIARKNQGMTQEALGKAIGHSQSVISRWESGEVSIAPADIVEIAKALNNPGLLKKHCAQCPVAAAMQQLHQPKPAA